MRLDGHTIRACALRALTREAEAEGVSAAALRQRVGVDGDILADPDRAVPLALTDAAWVWAARLGPPDVALRIAARVDAKAFGLLSYLLAASETVGAALARLARFYPVLSTGTRHRIAARGDAVEVVVELADPAVRSPVVESFAVGVVASFFRNETEGACAPTMIRLRQPAGALGRVHERILGAPVQFGARWSGVTVPRVALDLPLRGADPELARILEASALVPTVSGPSVAERVRACLRDGSHGAPAVAARVGLSERSLRRQLAAEDTSFADLVAAERSRIALRLLADPSLCLRDVAHRLGYAEPSSFARAFRRWHGVSPRAFAAATATATGRSH